MLNSDTIAAPATPPGRGGVGIIRVSGPKTKEIAKAILGVDDRPKPRYATLAEFKSEKGEVIDHGIALFFENPDSFTGEDVLELQGHGGPVVMDLLLQRLLELGARVARPGEFSERAFLNNKIDLAQAEAIADLIDSASQQSARAAMRTLRGEFSKKIHDLVEQLIQLRLFVEAAIDFPEEEIDFLADETLQKRLSAILADIHQLLQQAKQGQLLREGIRVVIIGPPNAGKSSLLNLLAGEEAAIVTPIAGTTRDILKETITIDGLALQFIDTAGLRVTEDIVEQEGMRRTWEAVKQADLILCMLDVTQINNKFKQEQSWLEKLPEPIPKIIIHNKIDLLPGSQKKESSAEIYLSTKTQAGFSELKDGIKKTVNYHPERPSEFTARRRHVEALRQAHQALLAGQHHLQSSKAGELLAEELRVAQQHLNEITGEFTSDDLLGRIFSSFCIGK